MRLTLTLCAAFFAATFAPISASAQQVVDVSGAASAPMAQIRAEAGLAQLAPSDALTKAAAAHARDMAQNGFFSHTGSNGSSIGDRARKARYGFCFIAENIAKGQGSLDQVMSGWMKSEGHRRNILSPNASEFALVRGEGELWVMVLGRPGC
ncbi:CAP domain-containing protein [Roseovarius sp. LXJ103]|uniref:CAP domain-containing protein n=1 Tax=Roseovarius carneus TaxID=2853164 RepID=UPI000D619255|nr:CAP domain-containing protein [Roseovarius carneus]MBZ8119679.1 CAP domain-containing protein [Roseovarius carneus]PWE34708.1 CAP domain-containing protein [Pelagicola sp. LXJ1103]